MRFRRFPDHYHLRCIPVQVSEVASIGCATEYNETEVLDILKKALIVYRNGAHENMFTQNDKYVVEY